MAPHPDWSQLRAEFPTLEHTNYLCSCSLGLLSRRTLAAVGRFTDLWTRYGAAAWYSHWLGEVAALRAEFAALINAGADEIAIMPNISSALAGISSSLQLSEGSEVITTDLDFPTVPHHFLAKAGQGVRTVILKTSDNIQIELDQYEKAVGDRTALVATSRVFFTSGYIQDMAAMADIAHRKGALLLVDDYQGTGQVPVDVKAVDVDILVTGGLKWLLGGPGVAYMYVRRDLVPRLTPTVAGWFGHRDQFAFNPHEMVFRDDAARFEAGTPSVPSVYAGAEGLRILNELGPQPVRERTSELTRLLVRRLRDEGFKLRVPEDPERHAGITMVEFDDPHSVVDELSRRNIVVDSRPGAVRISPYFYSSPDDIESAVLALCEIRTGAA